MEFFNSIFVVNFNIRKIETVTAAHMLAKLTLSLSPPLVFETEAITHQHAKSPN